MAGEFRDATQEDVNEAEKGNRLHFWVKIPELGIDFTQGWFVTTMGETEKKYVVRIPAALIDMPQEVKANTLRRFASFDVICDLSELKLSRL